MRLVTVALAALVFTFTACDGDDAPAPAADILTGADVPAPDTSAPPEDTTTPPEDTAPPEDTTTTPEDTASPEDTATPDTTPEDTATPPEDTATPPADTTPSNGACDNSADLAELEAIESTLEGTITSCVFGCLDQLANFASCGTSCIERDTELSNGCAACFGASMKCTVDNCVLACATPTAPGCATCQDEKGCTAAFDECSGVERP
jgi:hypothetical protein